LSQFRQCAKGHYPNYCYAECRYAGCRCAMHDPYAGSVHFVLVLSPASPLSLTLPSEYMSYQLNFMDFATFEFLLSLDTKSKINLDDYVKHICLNKLQLYTSSIALIRFLTKLLVAWSGEFAVI
jgi:hypothetical protein